MLPIKVRVKRFNGEGPPFQFVNNSAPRFLMLLLTLFQFGIKTIAHIYNKYSKLKKFNYNPNEQVINKLAFKTKNENDKSGNGIGTA